MELKIRLISIYIITYIFAFAVVILLSFSDSCAITKDVNWKAQWIWTGGDPQPRNYQLNIRKTFTSGGDVMQALLHISADSRYRLYLNNKWLGDGPCRSFPQHRQFDTYDITANLVSGKNIIAATVQHYGEETFHYVLGRGGFLCQIELRYPDGRFESIATDGSWKVAEEKAHERRTARISCQMPFEEQFDARKEERGWKSASFNDSQWTPATVIGPVGTTPWTGMEPRTIPFFANQERYPTRILGIRYVKPVNLIEGLNVRPSLTPGAKHANHNFYRGFVCTEIISPKAQKVTFPVTNTMGLSKPYLNGVRINKPGREGVTAELRAGSNLYVVELVGRDHYIDLALALDTESLISIRAPLSRPGKWLVIGPFASNEDADIERVRQIKSIDDLKTFERWFKSPAMENQHAADIYNITLSQKTLPGTPAIMNLTGMLANNANETIFQPSEKDIEVLLDFGEELVGHSEIEVNAPAGVIIDFNCFEAINDGKIQWTFGNRSSFRYVTREGTQAFTTMWRRGFRYAAMTLRNIFAPVRIRSVKTLLSTYPAVERGQFQCNDWQLNTIWKVGRHTLLCCMEDTYTDCPTYEQTFWVGDARNEALINTAAYGSWDLTARCVRLVPQSLYRSPLTESQVPSGWQNILTAWSFLWVKMAWEHYLYTGDKETLSIAYDGMSTMMNNVEKMTDNQWGLLSIDAWNMFDWAHTDTEHKLNTQNNLFLIGALDATLNSARTLDKSADTSHWEQFKQKIITNVNTYLWSDELNSYIDSIHDDGTKSMSISQQANTLALLYNAAPPDRADKIRPYLVNPPEKMVTFGSPFAMFYLLEELAQESRYGDLLAIIRDRWGFMIDAGATSFWETFPGYEKDVPTRSHCHAWSAAPTYFLTRYQLGVSPLAPGFEKALIAPQPVDLLWCKGKAPTPKGEISVNWKREQTSFALTTELPSRITGEIRLPAAPVTFTKLYINDKLYTGETIQGVQKVEKDAAAWMVTVDGGQRIRLKAERDR